VQQFSQQNYCKDIRKESTNVLLRTRQ